MNEFSAKNQELLFLIDEWYPVLRNLSEDIISSRRNIQQRTIKQIVGHMTDSATNNTHRIIHLQYQPNPLIFPDYATQGNNDRWIAIQNFQEEKWDQLVRLWKYSNIHLVHVISNINPEKLNHEWIDGLNGRISLREMVMDYLPHQKLHLDEIRELINKR
jgi:hypothetical protein